MMNIFDKCITCQKLDIPRIELGTAAHKTDILTTKLYILIYASYANRTHYLLVNSQMLYLMS